MKRSTARRYARDNADPVRRARRRLARTEYYWANVERMREQARNSRARIRAAGRQEERSGLHPLILAILEYEDELRRTAA